MNQAPTIKQAPTEDKSNPYQESFTRYKGGLDESSPYNKTSPYIRKIKSLPRIIYKIQRRA